jgi:hypothetical protein
MTAAVLSNFAICTIAFCVVASPHSKDGSREEGSLLTMAMISDEAWRKKSSNFTAGNGITVGKNSTVSAFLVPLVSGM